MADMMNLQLADQFSATLRDIFAEKGFVVEFSIPSEAKNCAAFSIQSSNRKITSEILEEVMLEAVKKNHWR